MQFYKPSSQKKLRKFFKNHNFTLEEGGNHTRATHNTTGEVFHFPRHNTVSSGLTKEICDRLIELGYEENEVKKILK
jgi:hypothetical protein